MTVDLARVLLAIVVAVAFVGAVGLVSADADSSDAGDRIGEMMPHDYSDHHDGDHEHGDHHDRDHDHGDHHDGESHC